MTDRIHSCSYYCSDPLCIKAQRDELRDAMGKPLAKLAAIDQELGLYPERPTLTDRQRRQAEELVREWNEADIGLGMQIAGEYMADFIGLLILASTAQPLKQQQN